LVLPASSDDDIVLARITGRASVSASDVEIGDLKSAGLVIPSWVRLHKVVTLERTLASDRLGTLGASDQQRVALLLRTLCVGLAASLLI